MCRQTSTDALRNPYLGTRGGPPGLRWTARRRQSGRERIHRAPHPVESDGGRARPSHRTRFDEGGNTDLPRADHEIETACGDGPVTVS